MNNRTVLSGEILATKLKLKPQTQKLAVRGRWQGGKKKEKGNHENVFVKESLVSFENEKSERDCLASEMIFEFENRKS